MYACTYIVKTVQNCAHMEYAQMKKFINKATIVLKSEIRIKLTLNCNYYRRPLLVNN